MKNVKIILCWLGIHNWTITSTAFFAINGVPKGNINYLKCTRCTCTAIEHKSKVIVTQKMEYRKWDL